MKHILINLTLIFLSYYSLAQGQLNLESPEVQSYAFQEENFPRLNGKFINYDPLEDSALTIEYFPTNFIDTSSSLPKLQVQEDGTFELEFAHAFPYQSIMLIIRSAYPIICQYQIRHGLELEIDLEKMKKSLFNYTPIISGQDRAINELLNKHNNFSKFQRAMQWKKSQALRKDEKLSWSEKTQKLKSIHLENLAQDEKYYAKYPDERNWLIADRSLSAYYAEMLKAYRGHTVEEDLLDSLLNHSPRALSQEARNYYQNLSRFLQTPNAEERLDFTRKVLKEELPGTLEQEAVNSFLASYKQRLLSEDYDSQQFEQDKEKYLNPFKTRLEEEEEKLFLAKLAKLPSQKAQMLIYTGQPQNLISREDYFEKMLHRMEDNPLKRQMQKVREKYKQELSELNKIIGKEAELNLQHPLGTHVLNLEGKGPLYLSDAKEVEAFIEKVRNQYEGKAIIFDVWTTWCGPCLKDFAESKEVKQQMKALLVQLVYLCMEDRMSKIENWKERVAKQGSEGVHIFLPREFARKFMDHFGFNAYPSYLFVDQAGNIDKKFIKRISMINVKKLEKRLEE